MTNIDENTLLLLDNMGFEGPEGIDDNSYPIFDSKATGAIFPPPVYTKLTKVNYTKLNNLNRIEYIVIHYVGAVSSAKNNADFFYEVDRGASANYFVDPVSIWQVVDDKDGAWHCGTRGAYTHPYCRNRNSIGIEMCVKKDSNGNWYIEEETLRNTIYLTRQLMNKYHISIDNVVRHNDVTGKVCPEPFVRNPLDWTEFKNNLQLEEDINMSLAAELQKQIDELKNANPMYATVNDVPEWGKETVQKLVDNKYLVGTGDSKIDLSYSDVRILVMLDRAGAFNK